MQSAAKLRRESDAAYQISPKPILDTNEYAKKEIGGRGGAHKSGRGLEGRAHQAACRIPIEGLRYKYTRALFL